jgi:hypothetical protein
MSWKPPCVDVGSIGFYGIFCASMAGHLGFPTIETRGLFLQDGSQSVSCAKLRADVWEMAQ